ncbi:hypothetical protein [Lactococcus lactis]|uniref:hypothetical protein n=1 Tax=Lactococcus lactis TaxID=1358 RepID=UPI003D177656
MTKSWNFHIFIDSLARNRKNAHGISKVELTLQVLDFIADYEDLYNEKQGRSYKIFKRITEESTARKLYGETPNPIPQRFIKPLSRKNFDFTLFLTKHFSDFAKNFNLSNLVPELTDIIEKSENYLTDESLKALVASARHDSAETFLARALIDVVKLRDNSASEREKSQAEEIPLDSLKDKIDDSSYQLLEHITQEVNRNDYAVRQLILMANGEPLPLERSDELRHIFHLSLSGFKHDLYRRQVIQVCLQVGFFAKNRAELLEHLAEFHEDKQLFELLKFMVQELHLIKEVEENQDYLEGPKYREALSKLLTDGKNWH